MNNNKNSILLPRGMHKLKTIKVDRVPGTKGILCVRPRFPGPNSNIFRQPEHHTQEFRVPRPVYPTAVTRRDISPRPSTSTCNQENPSASAEDQADAERFRQWKEATDNEIAESKIFLARRTQNSGTIGGNSKARRKLEYQGHREELPDHQTDMKSWDAAIDEGKFNPDSLLAGNEQQPLYTSINSESHESPSPVASTSCAPERATPRSLPSQKPVVVHDGGAPTSTSTSAERVASRRATKRPHQPSEMVLACGVASTSNAPERATPRSLPSQKPGVVRDGGATTSTSTSAERVAPRRATKRPHQPPEMVLACGDYLTEVTVESTPPNEETREAPMQWDNNVNDNDVNYSPMAVDDSDSPPSMGLDFTPEGDLYEMENLLKGPNIIPITPYAVEAQRRATEEDVDYFDSFAGLRRRGLRFSLLIRCPTRFCSKVGPYFALNNHYMMEHANTSITDETPYLKFLRNN